MDSFWINSFACGNLGLPASHFLPYQRRLSAPYGLELQATARLAHPLIWPS